MAYNPETGEYEPEQPQPNPDDLAADEVVRRTGGGGATTPSGQPKSTTPAIPPDESVKPKISPAIDYNREQFRDAWMADRGTLSEFASAHPEWGLQIFGPNKDKVRTPTGEVLDAVIGASRGGTQHGWTAIAGEGGIPVGTPGYNWGGAGSGSASGSASYSGGIGGNPQLDDLINQNLTRMLTKAGQPVTEADIASRYGPMSRAQQRARDQAKVASAHRLAFEGANQGGEGGALNAESGAIDEKYAENEGRLSAELIGEEIRGRREELVQALNYAQGEKRLQLQAQISAMDNELRRMGLSQENAHFYDTMGYNIGRDQAEMDYRYAELSGRGAGG